MCASARYSTSYTKQMLRPARLAFVKHRTDAAWACLQGNLFITGTPEESGHHWAGFCLQGNLFITGTPALSERLPAGRESINKEHARPSKGLQNKVLTAGALLAGGGYSGVQARPMGKHRRERSPPLAVGHMRHSRSLSQLSQQRQKQQQAASEAFRPQVRV